MEDVGLIERADAAGKAFERVEETFKGFMNALNADYEFFVACRKMLAEYKEAYETVPAEDIKEGIGEFITSLAYTMQAWNELGDHWQEIFDYLYSIDPLRKRLNKAVELEEAKKATLDFAVWHKRLRRS